MKGKYKYDQLLKPQEFGFLQYYMLPENNEFQYVYRPGDDSFLMLSVLKNQIESFPESPTICEIGSGSGILSAHVNSWLKKTNTPLLHLSTDISLDACILSQKYYNQYNLQIEQVCTSLLSSIVHNLHPQVMIFNPPYVPTELQQKQNELKYLKQKLRSVRQQQKNVQKPETNLIAFSYMGGPDGLQITRKLISSISWKTKLYFIVMGEQGLQKLQQQLPELLNKRVKGKCQVLQAYQKYNEDLYVLLLQTLENI